ncbi:IS3 family transposase [Paenibacillus sp. 2TAB26]|uniref:IS3 family transposase n=1 Tax=Paenibacillus sp. 2TAB26 TaxID=3233005 RepID=UPI003F97015A
MNRSIERVARCIFKTDFANHAHFLAEEQFHIEPHDYVHWFNFQKPRDTRLFY